MSAESPIGMYLSVHCADDADAARLVEALSRVMLGLVLDGYEVEFSAQREPDYFGNRAADEYRDTGEESE